MPKDPTKILIETIARTPDWLRRDLASDDAKLRGSAEETLAAMLAVAIGKASINPGE